MCIFQEMTAILNFGGHFGSYINYHISETFLLLNETSVDIFICALQEIVLCRWLKKIFLNPIADILELTAIATLKQKIRDGNIPGITEYI